MKTAESSVTFSGEATGPAIIVDADHLGLRTRTRPGKQYAGLSPILFYFYAEPDLLPNSNKLIADEAKAVHRDEIRHFSQSVQGDEVRFVFCTYRDLLAMWSRDALPETREHARAVVCRYSP